MGAAWVDAVLGALGKALLGLVGFLALCLAVGVLREARSNVANSAWFKRAFPRRLRRAAARDGGGGGPGGGGEHADAARGAGPTKHNLKEKIEKVMKVNKNVRQTAGAGARTQPPQALGSGRRNTLSSYVSHGSSRPTSAASRKAVQSSSGDVVPYYPVEANSSRPPDRGISREATASPAHSTSSRSGPRAVAAATASKRRLNSLNVPGSGPSTPTGSAAWGAAAPQLPQSADSKPSSRARHSIALLNGVGGSSTSIGAGAGSSGSSERQKFKERARAIKFKRVARAPQKSWSDLRAGGLFASDADHDSIAAAAAAAAAEAAATASSRTLSGVDETTSTRHRDFDSLRNFGGTLTANSDRDVTAHGSAETLGSPNPRDLEEDGDECVAELDSLRGPHTSGSLLGALKSLLLAAGVACMALCLVLALMCVDAAEDNSDAGEGADVKSAAVLARECLRTTQRLHFVDAPQECPVFLSLAGFKQGTRSIRLLGCIVKDVVWPLAPEAVRLPTNRGLAALANSPMLKTAGAGLLILVQYVGRAASKSGAFSVALLTQAVAASSKQLSASLPSSANGANDAQTSAASAESTGATGFLGSAGLFMLVAVAIVAASKVSYKHVLSFLEPSSPAADAKSSAPSVTGSAAGGDQGTPRQRSLAESRHRREADHEGRTENGGKSLATASSGEAGKADSSDGFEGEDAQDSDDAGVDDLDALEGYSVASRVLDPDNFESVSWDALSRTVSRDLYVASAHAGSVTDGERIRHRLGRTESSPEAVTSMLRGVEAFATMGFSQPDILGLSSTRSHASAPQVSGKLHGLSGPGSEASQDSTLHNQSLLSAKRAEAERLRFERLHERLQQTMDRISQSLRLPKNDDSLASVRASLSAMEQTVYLRRGVKQRT